MSYVAPLLISAALVAPFIGLQWANRREFQEDFPVVLFTFMTVHSLAIVFVLTPALRRLHAARSIGALGFGHWAGLLLGAVLVYAYTAVVMDQLPCFLGVPNCD